MDIDRIIAATGSAPADLDRDGLKSDLDGIASLYRTSVDIRTAPAKRVQHVRRIVETARHLGSLVDGDLRLRRHRAALERLIADAQTGFPDRLTKGLGVGRGISAFDQERERPCHKACSYVGFVDPSGGSADSFTLAIAHMEDAIAVLDAVREAVPPFSPAAVVEDFADVLRGYGIRTVHGDRYGGEWPREQFALNGISYQPSELSKSEIYAAFLPMLNSRTVALLTNDRLHRQLVALELRTARGGRDMIDHPRGGRDDVANAAAGALVLVREVPRAASASNFNRPIEYPSMGVV
jgi:hypothetical protein